MTKNKTIIGVRLRLLIMYAIDIIWVSSIVLLDLLRPLSYIDAMIGVPLLNAFMTVAIVYISMPLLRSTVQRERLNAIVHIAAFGLVAGLNWTGVWAIGM